eukprot:m.39912 g.39912  ORF g.39912 m.39912 type:complete len:316 (-) comp14768_c0_seq3:1404-2351(-)
MDADPFKSIRKELCELDTRDLERIWFLVGCRPDFDVDKAMTHLVDYCFIVHETDELEPKCWIFVEMLDAIGKNRLADTVRRLCNQPPGSDFSSKFDAQQLQKAREEAKADFRVFLCKLFKSDVDDAVCNFIARSIGVNEGTRDVQLARELVDAGHITENESTKSKSFVTLLKENNFRRISKKLADYYKTRRSQQGNYDSRTPQKRFDPGEDWSTSNSAQHINGILLLSVHNFDVLVIVNCACAREPFEEQLRSLHLQQYYSRRGACIRNGRRRLLGHTNGPQQRCELYYGGLGKQIICTVVPSTGKAAYLCTEHR